MVISSVPWTSPRKRPGGRVSELKGGGAVVAIIPQGVY